MGRLTLRFGFYVVILVFGILIGMDIVEKGIFRIAGNPSDAIQYLEISDQSQKKLISKKTISELQQSPSPEQLEKKPLNQSKQSDKMTFISRIGNILGSIAQSGTDKGMELIASLIP